MSIVKSLMSFKEGFTSILQQAFDLKYGNILNIRFVPIKKEAITALSQFYDPQLRSFLFLDFQLALTLEEFGRILDSPKEKNGPYKGVGEVPEA